MPEGYKLGTVAKSKDTRLRKAKKLITILSQYKDLKQARVLDIGTGAGYIAHVLSKEAKKVDSVDIIDDRLIKEGYSQKIVKDEKLPYDNKTFDIVITNHVLEHVPDQVKHFSEIRRVLKDDGIVYLASPNKWWLTDPHYKLPLISWLPRSLSAHYLMLTKGRKWDIYSVSLRRLHKLAREQSLDVIDKAWDIMAYPKEHAISFPASGALVARRMPRPARRALSHILPTHTKILAPMGKRHSK